MDTTSNRIKKAMSLRNMRQIDLASKTGISKGALSSYISGRYVPKQNNIYLIAKALNVNEAWLMGLDAPMERIDDDQRIIQYEAESDEACKILEKAGYTVDFSTSNNNDIIIKDKHGNISCLHEDELVNRFEKIKSKSLDAINAEQLLEEIDMDAQHATNYTNFERDHIKKYRSLDEYGKDMVDTVLNKEYDRCTNSKITEISQVRDDVSDYLAPEAAHERTDIPVTDEMKAHDDDIMDNF